MGAFSNYLEKKLIGHTLLGTPYTSPGTVWLTLGTSLNSDGDFYTEVTTNVGYARLPALFVAPTSGPTWRTFLASNATWAAATSPWGGITHFAIFDSSTIGAGNMLYWGALTTVRSVVTNDTFEFALGSGNLEIQLD